VILKLIQQQQEQKVSTQVITKMLDENDRAYYLDVYGTFHNFSSFDASRDNNDSIECQECSIELAKFQKESNLYTQVYPYFNSSIILTRKTNSGDDEKTEATSASFDHNNLFEIKNTSQFVDDDRPPYSSFGIKYNMNEYSLYNVLVKFIDKSYNDCVFHLNFKK
jgi:hypothetical protein